MFHAGFQPSTVLGPVLEGHDEQGDWGYLKSPKMNLILGHENLTWPWKNLARHEFLGLYI